VIAAAALVKDKTHLVGYFSPADVNVGELREFVASQLPVYMVPAVWIGMDNLPLNTNGKIDRRALQALDADVTIEPLETAEEIQLAQVWSDVLGVPFADIGRTSSFFALGGDSISSIKVVAECAKLGLTLTVAKLMTEAVLHRVAQVSSDAVTTVWPSSQLDTSIAEEVKIFWSDKLNLDDFSVYPVTPLQGGMLYATLSDPTAYVMQLPIPIDSAVEPSTVLESFERLVEQHEMLRTTFVTTTTGLTQIIREDAVGVETASVAVDHLEEYLSEDMTRGFELGDKFFVRLAVVSEPCARHAVLTIHHALYDGWSTGMIVSDLMDLVHGKPLVPRAPFRTVVDYIEAQDKSKMEAFWRSYLSGVVPSPLTLTTATSTVERGSLSLTPTLPLQSMTDAAKRMGTTLAVFTKLAWAATLRKFTRSNDIVLGQVMANRDMPVMGVDRIIGPLLSTVPCRVQFDDSQTLQELVSAVQNQQGTLSANAHASLVDVKRWSGADGDLYDTLFVFQNLPDVDADLPESSEDALPPQTTSHHVFELGVEPSSTSMTVNGLYDPLRMSWSQARSLLDEFDYTLTQLHREWDRAGHVSALWDLSPAREDAVLLASQGLVSPVEFTLLHEPFETTAKLQPDLPAVEFEGSVLSYGQLNAQANAVASELVEVGAAVGSCVAVIMDRCLEFPIGLMAVLKAGGTMMPQDASFPAARLAYALHDAGTVAVVTTEAHRGRIQEMRLDIPVVYIDTSELASRESEFTPAQLPSGDNAAFIVYTSGSTGQPKGVPVLHKSALNAAIQCSSRLEMRGARILQFLAIGFDGCQWETWMAFSSASTLVLRTSELDSDLKNVDMVAQTVTGLSLMGDPSNYPNLKCVCVGGEAMPPHLRDTWAEHVRLANVYGPSEGSMITHVEVIAPSSAITIGSPIPNVVSYVLDDSQRVVPVGVVGELYLGGVCVSPCYVNLPEQTAERFLVDPFTGGRMFRTGDCARLLPSGKFEILGRKDSQVKLKGYRVELDEVGEAMMRHGSVIAAAALVKDKTH
ncbi:hypothetical protein DYB32_010358, partial [Aphanomyces invadans]